MILLGRLPFRYGAPPPPPQTQHAGFRSIPGKWVGGFGAPPPPSRAGYRSAFGRWVGGFAAPTAVPPPPTIAGYRSVFGRWVGGLSAPNVAKAKKVVGWARFTHTVEELEERLRLQRESTPQWFYRFARAHKAALTRAAKTKSERQRVALEEAADSAAIAAFELVADYRESIDDVITELERAAGATRLTASLKHCQAVIELMLETDETEAELMILLH